MEWPLQWRKNGGIFSAASRNKKGCEGMTNPGKKEARERRDGGGSSVRVCQCVCV